MGEAKERRDPAREPARSARERLAAAGHPGLVDLERFMRGGLSREEVRDVVRHLLTRCPQCAAATRRLWGLGEQRPALKALAEEMARARPRYWNCLRAEGGIRFMKKTAEARAQLLEIERQLEAIRFRLLGVQASLPPAPMEIVPLLEVETMDATTQIRAVIKCVLEDSIGPAIRDLREVAALREDIQ